MPRLGFGADDLTSTHECHIVNLQQALLSIRKNVEEEHDDDGDVEDDESDVNEANSQEPPRSIEHAPRPPPGALHPSVGSEGHALGVCKRCCFFPRGRCLNGYSCEFCHYEHEKRKRKNKKGNKAASAGTLLPAHMRTLLSRSGVTAHAPSVHSSLAGVQASCAVRSAVPLPACMGSAQAQMMCTAPAYQSQVMFQTQPQQGTLMCGNMAVNMMPVQVSQYQHQAQYMMTAVPAQVDLQANCQAPTMVMAGPYQQPRPGMQVVMLDPAFMPQPAQTAISVTGVPDHVPPPPSQPPNFSRQGL